MKTKTVKDLMIPLAGYATASKEATLSEAILALEKAQQAFEKNLYPHRAVLIYDENNEIVGKISQLDILRALEPKYDQILERGSSIARFGFSRKFQRCMIDQFNLWDKPFTHICKKASEIKVKDFMYTPGEGEFVDENATLDSAIHQLVIGHHQSLLVTRNGKIVGILRLTDVFMEVFDTIRTTCEI